MKDQINNFFHTDKWWGKTIFIILIYAVYWCVFYGVWFLIPPDNFDKNTDISGILFLILNLAVVPIISFFIPYFIKKLFTINKVVLYVLHSFLLLISVALFIFLAIISALSHIQIG
ncbi:MAG: hypothetical protein V4439_01855 [Patescibacteria group bacterium]